MTQIHHPNIDPQRPARLFLAAEDLLAALKWVVDHPDECIGDSYAQLRKAKAAIARAETGIRPTIDTSQNK